MSTFKEIQGRNIRSYTTNPDNPLEGQMWYNQTELKLKGVTASGAWASSSLMTNVKSYRFGGGTQTAAFAAGGSSLIASTEEYNGSGWSAGGDLGTGRYQGGSAGSLTAGLAFGGYSTDVTNNTEEYNGTAWSEQNNLSTSGYSAGGFGTQTAAVYTNRYAPSLTNDTEEYNGTSWSEGNNSSTNRADLGTAGTLTAGMIFGGQNPPPSVFSATELYDGTNWTTAPSMNSARSQLGGSGTQTSAIAFGGRFTPPGSVLRAFTEQYDGTSWSEVGDLATARRQVSSTRVETGNTSALAIGGKTSSATAATEEWNFTANTITAATWASGGNLNTARQRAASAGASQTAALAFGGFEAPPGGPPLNNSETYNGTAWSEGNNLGTARGNTSGFGTATAAVCGPGRGTPSGPFIQNTEEYDGTSWTAGNTSNTSGAAARSASGTLTAGLICGGFTPPSAAPAEHVNNVEEYDGTNWTNATVMPQYQAYNCQCGTQTATLNGGGNAGPNGPTANTNAISLNYDGTNWTAGPNANILSDKFTAYNGGTGTQTSALFVGGDGTVSARFDGTAFSTDASYPAARGETNSAGSAPSTSALIYAGSPVPGVGNSTLEYSGETTAANIVDITTS